MEVQRRTKINEKEGKLKQILHVSLGSLINPLHFKTIL